MTLRAVASEFSVVTIFFGVTAVAIRSNASIFCRPIVATGAGQIGVCTGQRKMRFFGVIKFPIIPAARVVALPTGFAETAFVLVVAFVAIDTGQRCIFIGTAQMTARAVHRGVQTQ